MQGWDVGGAVQSWGLDLRILVGLFLLGRAVTPWFCDSRGYKNVKRQPTGLSKEVRVSLLSL